MLEEVLFVFLGRSTSLLDASVQQYCSGLCDSHGWAHNKLECFGAYNPLLPLSPPLRYTGKQATAISDQVLRCSAHYINHPQAKGLKGLP